MGDQVEHDALASLNFLDAASDPWLRSGCHFKACERVSVLDRGMVKIHGNTHHLLVRLFNVIVRGASVDAEQFVVVFAHSWIIVGSEDESDSIVAGGG